jgi:hypothetical protein
MSKIITVTFRDRVTDPNFESMEYSYFCDIDVEPGDYVIVDTVYGPNIAKVCKLRAEQPEKANKSVLLNLQNLPL